ncbi:MAG: transglutaminase-like domain-containing protein [Oscillospiraceae bacterium]|nr:transglutaminase-like domain-containing protein [Oscillospiraceae bacterium]
MKSSLWDDLPRWLLTWLVCFALEQGLGSLLRIDSRWWLALLVLLLWCALAAAAGRFGRFWGMLALWIAAFGLCLLLTNRAMLLAAARAAISRSGAAGSAGELFLLLLCGTLALPLSALLRFYGARAALSVGWTAVWIAAALLEWPLPRMVPAAMAPLLLLTLAETIRRLRREAEPGKALKRALLLSLLPAVLLLALLPAPAEPFEYPLLHSVAEKVEKLWHDAKSVLFYRLEGDRDFGLSFNGVSDEASLGQGIEGEGVSAIFAKAVQTPNGPVYLFGNAWNHFDGRNWSSTLEPEAAELLNARLDTAERIYAFWRVLGAKKSSADFSDYFRANSVYLSCRNLNLRTMFSVWNTTRFFTDEQRFPYADAPTGSRFDYIQANDVWYRIYFLESNVRLRGALIAAAEGTAYDPEAHGPLWYRVADDLHGSLRMDLDDNLNLEKTFARRTELIRGAYLDCTGVSDRARALAEEITANCGSDAEKAAAIAAYLQENYSYTLRPAPVPEGENFLDWLLFESREGYCAWYATAAALLARSVGVPARYVQGYRTKLTGDVFVRIGAGDAHAWCECYLAGFGWVTVEATPGFKGEGVGWLTAEEERVLLEKEAESRASSGTELILSGADEDGREPPEPTAEPDQAGGNGGSGRAAPEEESAPPRFGWLSVLLSVGLPAALLGAWLWPRAQRKRRYQKAEPAARLLLDLEQLLSDLRGKGYPRRPEEPLRQYFARLPWHYLLASEAEAEKMAALYDRTFFAQQTPSEAELAEHRAFAARFRPRTLRQWLIWYRLRE